MFLTESICKAHSSTLVDPFEWYLEDDPRPKTEELFAKIAAGHFFLGSGQGYFENDVFLLHGFTYDQTCVCGALDSEFPVELEHLFDKSQKEDVRYYLCACPYVSNRFNDQPLFLPSNFVHKPTGIAADWRERYIYGMRIQGEEHETKWPAIIQECLASVGEGKAFTEIKEWPCSRTRKASCQELIEKAITMPDDFVNAVARDSDW